MTKEEAENEEKTGMDVVTTSSTFLLCLLSRNTVTALSSFRRLSHLLVSWCSLASKFFFDSPSASGQEQKKEEVLM